jgi:predicted CoA-substrate-specific enzyme activase
MITAGVDMGLRYVKVVILKDWKRVGFAIAAAGYDHDRSSRYALKKALKMAGLKKSDINYIVSTGIGRRKMSLANGTISEISANARGVKWLNGRSDVHSIIDLGGHDTKVIAIDDEHHIQNFEMNDRYEAGTGQFIEELAKVLKVPLEKMGEMALTARDPVEISANNLEYAKTEVTNLVLKGYKKEDIIAGIYRAVARRLAAMAKRVGIKGTVVFDGGPAKNIGMIKALERELGMKLYVPDNPQIVAATGATLIAAERFKGNGGSRN